MFVLLSLLKLNKSVPRTRKMWDVDPNSSFSSFNYFCVLILNCICFITFTGKIRELYGTFSDDAGNEMASSCCLCSIGAKPGWKSPGMACFAGWQLGNRDR